MKFLILSAALFAVSLAAPADVLKQAQTLVESTRAQLQQFRTKNGASFTEAAERQLAQLEKLIAANKLATLAADFKFIESRISTELQILNSQYVQTKLVSEDVSGLIAAAQQTLVKANKLKPDAKDSVARRALIDDVAQEIPVVMRAIAVVEAMPQALQGAEFQKAFQQLHRSRVTLAGLVARIQANVD